MGHLLPTFESFFSASVRSTPTARTRSKTSAWSYGAPANHFPYRMIKVKILQPTDKAVDDMAELAFVDLPRGPGDIGVGEC